MKEYELRNLLIDIYPASVEMPHDDFEYLIEAALNHNDDFFVVLLEKYDEVKEKQFEKGCHS